MFIDCCDGSDEWENNLKNDSFCDNTCGDLGRAAREAAEREQRVFTAGNEIRSQLIARGKKLRLEKEVNDFNLKKFYFILI